MNKEYIKHTDELLRALEIIRASKAGDLAAVENTDGEFLLYYPGNTSVSIEEWVVIALAKASAVGFPEDKYSFIYYAQNKGYDMLCRRFGIRCIPLREAFISALTTEELVEIDRSMRHFFVKVSRANDLRDGREKYHALLFYDEEKDRYCLSVSVKNPADIYDAVNLTELHVRSLFKKIQKRDVLTDRCREDIAPLVERYRKTRDGSEYLRSSGKLKRTAKGSIVS